MSIHAEPHKLGICPLNMGLFESLSLKSPSLDATFLLSKIAFQQKRSHFRFKGRAWIIRSREQMAQWLGCSTRKIDRLLLVLEKQGLLQKKQTLWFGKKSLKVSVHIDLSPIFFESMDPLIEAVGSRHAAFIFSYILYAFSGSRIHHHHQKWCVLSRKQLSDFFGLSLRTIDAHIAHLIAVGFLEKRQFLWQGKQRTHFRPTALANTSLRCHTPQKPRGANLSASIRLRTNISKINNTFRDSVSQSLPQNSDINFKKEEGHLTPRQVAYLRGALANTQKKYALRLSHPSQVWDELVFSLTNPVHTKNVCNFQHGVSRAMLLLSQGRWRTPFGFFKYSEAGKRYADIAHQNEKIRQARKREAGARDENRTFVASIECRLPDFQCNRLNAIQKPHSPGEVSVPETTRLKATGRAKHKDSENRTNPWRAIKMKMSQKKKMSHRRKRELYRKKKKGAFSRKLDEHLDNLQMSEEEIQAVCRQFTAPLMAPVAPGSDEVVLQAMARMCREEGEE